jgi:integrase
LLYKNTDKQIVADTDSKPLVWIASSRRDMRAMPKDVRRSFGVALYTVQMGPPDGISQCARPGRGGDREACGAAFKGAAAKLGLSEGLCVHSLRHTFGTRTAKLAIVQTLMGPGSYKTTQKYVHLTDDDLMHATALV